MAKILAVGIATLDIINTVVRYPEQDSETRALSQQKARGGNATNTLVVLSQLGHQCDWAGVLIDETDSQLIRHDLSQYNIGTQGCQQLAQGKMPTSYITLDQQTGARTIVHFRDCPEYPFAQFKTLDLAAYDWIHFEGRNIDETRLMLEYLRQFHPNIPCSLEVEKPRQAIESLFFLPNVLLFSKDYALSQGFERPETFLASLARSHTVPMTCTWGSQGAWAVDVSQKIHHVPASLSRPIVDTVAAGDTFNAGLIHCLSQKQALHLALPYATQLATHKCQQGGLTNLTYSFHYQEP